MPAFILAIFLSAFLLFQVQPVIARFILPWYGGSPAVWTTCLLFFQCGLLAGYAYAHGLVQWLRNRRNLQIGIHLALLGLSLLTLPITPEESLKPTTAAENPVPGILLLLATTVGFPYLLLSASGPLLQHWFSEAFPGKSPYRLYAVSNVGSILGLLTYPFLFEPLFAVSRQTWLWSFAFIAYALLAIGCAIIFLKRAQPAGASSNELIDEKSPAPLMDRLLWIAFAACGSMLLLSLTNQMCQDVAVVPFLWVLPLALYLLTFVITFDHSRWYRRRVAVPLAIVAVGLVAFLINQQFASGEIHIAWQITIYVGAIFFGCLVCHGEVVRMKPHSHHLTGFYLAISLGGAIGGLFVSLMAPRWFDGYWELHVSLFFLAILTSIQLVRRFNAILSNPPVAVSAIAWVGLLTALAYSLLAHIRETREDSLAAKRSFYGVLNVYEIYPGTEDEYRALYHGRISHGRQYMADQWRDLAATYYSEDSGIGAIFYHFPQRVAEKPLHIGVVGLGIGTIATYARPGDRVRFYEINPQVEELALSHFSYLEDCRGEVEVVLGDARVSLETELEETGPQQFDVLVVDAFSGDSIPIHLLTVEAIDLYSRHLKADGVMAIHISNLHLDLSSPVRNLADYAGYEAVRVAHEPAYDDYANYYSDWVLVTRNQEFLSAIEIENYVSEWYSQLEPKLIWSDDYSNLLQVIDWES
ncbi:MAG: fused MFS/spermidine synthase [Verrucomicrobiota bacterium]